MKSWYDWAKGWQNTALDQYPIAVSDENLIGDTLHTKMARDYVLVKNYPKQTYLNRIVARLAAQVERKGIRYQVHVIDDSKTYNAFSIAGGHIYITEKMVDWAATEDELAFVLAHEMAHIDGKHAIRKIQQTMLSQHYFGSYGQIAANVSLMLVSPFGQIDEYAADRGGAVLLTKAGYNVRKGLRFFQVMAGNETYNSYEKMIRTHPYSAERHTCLEDFITNTLKK